jgi:hypothetical protein
MTTSTLRDHKGHEFRMDIEFDHDNGPPWESDCGHGPVTDRRRGKKKRPGEVVLCEDQHLNYRFYDMREAVKIAKRDGWGFGYADKGRVPVAEFPRVRHMSEFEFKLWYAGLSKGQRAHIAARLDFKRLKDWCDDRWGYIGVVVKHTDSQIERSCWGIESDCHEHIDEVACGLMDEIIRELEQERKVA